MARRATFPASLPGLIVGKVKYVQILIVTNAKYFDIMRNLLNTMALDNIRACLDHRRPRYTRFVAHQPHFGTLLLGQPSARNDAPARFRAQVEGIGV